MFAAFLAPYTPIKSLDNSFHWTAAVTMFLLALRVTYILKWLLEDFSTQIFGGNCQKAPYAEP